MRPMLIGLVSAAFAACMATVGCSHDNDNRGAAQPSNPALTNPQPIDQNAVYGAPSPADTNMMQGQQGAAGVGGAGGVNGTAPGVGAPGAYPQQGGATGVQPGNVNSPTNTQPINPTTPGNTTPGNASPTAPGAGGGTTPGGGTTLPGGGTAPGVTPGAGGTTPGAGGAADAGITPIYGSDGGSF